MTCQYCVAVVGAAVGALDGVTGVDLDLATGDLTVHGTRGLTESDVAAAVVQAGYELVPYLPRSVS